MLRYFYHRFRTPLRIVWINSIARCTSTVSGTLSRVPRVAYPPTYTPELNAEEQCITPAKKHHVHEQHRAAVKVGLNDAKLTGPPIHFPVPARSKRSDGGERRRFVLDYASNSGTGRTAHGYCEQPRKNWREPTHVNTQR